MHAPVKIWYSLCFFFSVYNLKLLIHDRYLTSYIVVDRQDELYSEKFVHTVCISFDDVKFHNRLLVEANAVSIDRFLQYSMESIADALHLDFPTNLFDLTNSYINNQQVCFPYDYRATDNSSFFRSLISSYRTFFYLHTPSKQPFSSEYYFEKYDRLQFSYSQVKTQMVYGENFLKDSNCFYNTSSRNRFFCLDACFKQIEKTEFNFYRFNENATLNLSLIGGRRDQSTLTGLTRLSKENSTRKLRKPNYEGCFDQCPNSDCFLEIYFSSNKDSHQDLCNAIDENDQFVTPTIYRAIYSLTYFWLQLFGLATLFTGTSLIVTLPALLARLYDRFKFQFGSYQHLRYFKRWFPKFQLALLAFSSLIFVGQSFSMYQDYRHLSLFPNRTRITNYTSEIEAYSLVLCLAVPNEFQSDTVQAIANLSEQLSRAFDVNLLYGERKEKFKYSISSKLLFKGETFNGENRTARCFRLDFTEFFLLKYRRAIPFSLIQVRFETAHWIVYLTEPNQPLTTRLEGLSGEHYFEKDTYQYLELSEKSNCKDYSKDAELHCFSKQHCLDRCYNRLFFQTHQTISTHSIVDLDEFGSFELAGTYFNRSEDPAIRAFCENEFKFSDCMKSVYIKKKPGSTYNYHPREIYLNFNYVKNIERELEQSVVKLVLNILNLESILFGSNATSLLLTVFHLLKKAFKLKWRQAYRVLVFIICLIGFLVHNNLIFREIFNGELVDSGYFQLIEPFEMPKVIFCSVISPDVDPNYKLTGELLDRRTDNLTYRSVFSKLGYFNKTHWKTFRPTNTSESPDGQLSITHFYFENLKCFEVALKVKFMQEDFFFKADKHVLNVFFEESFLNRTRHVYFLCRGGDSKEFNGYYFFRLGRLVNRTAAYHKYQIAFESLVIKRDDKFERFKHPRNLFSFERSINNVTHYLNSMKQTFESKFNLTTKEIFLEASRTAEFRYEIDDELFDQYGRQIQNQSDQNPTSRNYEKHFFNLYALVNNVNEAERPFGEFSFTFYFFRRCSEFTNDDNFSKLVQSLLNTLSLWLDTCILDVHLHLFKLFYVFKLLHRFLIAQEVRARNYLEAHSIVLSAPSQANRLTAN